MDQDHCHVFESERDDAAGDEDGPPTLRSGGAGSAVIPFHDAILTW